MFTAVAENNCAMNNKDNGDFRLSINRLRIHQTFFNDSCRREMSNFTRAPETHLVE